MWRVGGSQGFGHGRNELDRTSFQVGVERNAAGGNRTIFNGDSQLKRLGSGSAILAPQENHEAGGKEPRMATGCSKGAKGESPRRSLGSPSFGKCTALKGAGPDVCRPLQALQTFQNETPRRCPGLSPAAPAERNPNLKTRLGLHSAVESKTARSTLWQNRAHNVLAAENRRTKRFGGWLRAKKLAGRL